MINIELIFNANQEKNNSLPSNFEVVTCKKCSTETHIKRVLTGSKKSRLIYEYKKKNYYFSYS